MHESTTTRTPHFAPRSNHRPSDAHRMRAGVTLVEIMVVVAVIAALVGILLPALGILRKNADMVASQSNLRTIGALMTTYSLDNRDHVLPSQFDYTLAAGKTQVRTPSPVNTTPNTGALLKGSWTDILWTLGKFGPIVPLGGTDVPSPTWDYRYDSPDFWAYDRPDMVESNPFRSKAPLLKPFSEVDGDARPFGNGASIREKGQPGYFAANDFFDSRTKWYTNAMIRQPGNSLYIVDSRAGETIPLPATATNAWKPADPGCEVEFRYVGDVCCMLFLDAHVTTSNKWIDLADLQNNRQTRVERLDQRN
jgi:prepilin-type N-terminal cleavage/methylation domain-containing protein